MNEVKFLLVDDHPILRKGILSLFQEQEGFSVVGEASNGLAALEILRRFLPKVVVMDIHLPSENGIAISRRMLAEFPDLKIIAFSADSNLALVHEALQAGIMAYLIKENAGLELLRAIRSVLDQRIYLSPEIASVVVHEYLKNLKDKTIPSLSQPLLTEREHRLLKLVAEGKQNKEIAQDLNVGVRSTEVYRSRLMKKLGCVSANELTRYAIRAGIAAP